MQFFLWRYWKPFRIAHRHVEAESHIQTVDTNRICQSGAPPQPSYLRQHRPEMPQPPSILSKKLSSSATIDRKTCKGIGHRPAKSCRIHVHNLRELSSERRKSKRLVSALIAACWPNFPSVPAFVRSSEADGRNGATDGDKKTCHEWKGIRIRP